MPSFEPNALLACDTCGDVFINWSAGGGSCNRCQGTAVHAIRAYEPERTE